MCLTAESSRPTRKVPVWAPEGSHSLTSLSAPPVATTLPLLQAHTVLRYALDHCTQAITGMSDALDYSALPGLPHHALCKVHSPTVDTTAPGQQHRQAEIQFILGAFEHPSMFESNAMKGMQGSSTVKEWSKAMQRKCHSGLTVTCMDDLLRLSVSSCVTRGHHSATRPRTLCGLADLSDFRQICDTNLLYAAALHAQ